MGHCERSEAIQGRFLGLSVLLVCLLPLTACTSAPKPLHLTYPHSWIDYGAIENLDTIAKRVSPYFVKVFVYNNYELSEAVGVGSGTIIDELGHVVTAAHIVKGPEHRAYIKTMQGMTLPANIIHVDPDQELALLRIAIRFDAVSDPPITAQPVPGQSVFAIGTQSTYDPVVSAGTIQSYQPGRQFRSGNYGFESPVVLNMHVDTGYSGGPVFTPNGELLGMVIGFDGVNIEQTDAEKVLTSYAIPASKLYEF